MRKGLLVIGDRKINSRKLAPSFNAFVKHVRKSKSRNLEFQIISYNDVLAKKLPAFSSRILSVILFFPFEYWNKNIEVYNRDSRIYGDRKFGEEYKKFFKRAERLIEKKYHDKKIKYVNPLKSSLLERDKKEAKILFKKNNIPTARSFHIKTPDDVKQLVKKGLSLYIKPRFGSMGKGITYVNENLISTNFLFRKGKIVSRKYDCNWPFTKISEKSRNRFLKILISKDFIFEEAIEPPVYKGRRFDFRVYCVYGGVPYYYAKSMPAFSPVTNWAQGGRIEKKAYFSTYVSESEIKKARFLARKVTRTFNLNYAGVDIIFSKRFKKPYVLEVHSFPGFEKRFDLMGYLAKKVLER
ncbi:MAG: hypothetical protein KAI03_04590 [Candidatus Aureabacteria bacterium]|nr:hypothetical protein [Candidatus Auribacterota bacterium]